MAKDLEEVLVVVSIEEFREFIESVTSSDFSIENAMINDGVIHTLRTKHCAYKEEDDSLHFTLEHLLNASVLECTSYLKGIY